MSEQPIAEEAKNVTSGEEAEKIVNLGNIMVNNPFPEFYEGRSSLPLFSTKQDIPKEAIWYALLLKHGAFSENRLRKIGDFFSSEVVRLGIRQVHDQLIHSSVDPKNRWLTSTIIYPLVEKLLTEPYGEYQEVFNRWKDDWSQRPDSVKLKMALSLYFTMLSWQSLDVQREHCPGIPSLREQPVQISEAEFLAGIFEKVTAESNDKQLVAEADKRNRLFVEQIEKGERKFTIEDLYHKTDIDSLPRVIQDGLLSTECTSFTSDWMGEAGYATSFFAFRGNPDSFSQVLNGLKSGEKTYKHLAKPVYLAFLDPLSSVNPEFVLYPPDSFFSRTREKSNKIASRYIGGYDADSKDPNKTVAYVLIGVPSTAISFVVFNEDQQEEYASLANDYPFYIPAYSYEGKLLYSPAKYDTAKSKG